MQIWAMSFFINSFLCDLGIVIGTFCVPGNLNLQTYRRNKSNNVMKAAGVGVASQAVSGCVCFSSLCCLLSIWYHPRRTKLSRNMSVKVLFPFLSKVCFLSLPQRRKSNSLLLILCNSCSVQVSDKVWHSEFTLRGLPARIPDWHFALLSLFSLVEQLQYSQLCWESPLSVNCIPAEGLYVHANDSE